MENVRSAKGGVPPTPTSGPRSFIPIDSRDLMPDAGSSSHVPWGRGRLDSGGRIGSRGAPRRLCCAALAVLSAALLVCSCAAPPPAPPAPPVPYQQLKESIEGLDTSALEGARIVIDPGHGGGYAGALGPTGLREADVNLGVALNLWGLLYDAGADVTLTRSTDMAVAAGDTASLRDDLLARAAEANDSAADVFISIHHNSDLSRDPTINRIETYHKLFDEGPSLDLARALHNHLSYNIGETRGGVIPGNYLVLRECEGPAVLGEPSFISNPEIEARLKEAEVQRLEAVAYFLGLVDYFSRGVPRIETIAPATGEPTGPRSSMEFAVSPGRGQYGIDPSSIELKLDGVPAPVSYDEVSGIASFTPKDALAAGKHTASIRARNTAGNWSPALSVSFDVQTTPAHLTLGLQREWGTQQIAVGDSPVAVEARVYDENMNPVGEGTPVVFSCKVGVCVPETSLVRSGSALCYVWSEPAGSFEVEASCGDVGMGFAVDPRMPASRGAGWWAFLRDAQDDAPVAGAVISVDGGQMGRSNADGFVSFPVPDSTEGTWRIEAPGYEWRSLDSPSTKKSLFSPSSQESVKVVSLERAAAGLLHGLVIAIDPEGGGDDRAGQGPSGTDASWVNYEVASTLADLIAGSGGRAVLTRDRNEGASEVARLTTVERAGADRYIMISHSPRNDGSAPYIGHYPGSTTGISLGSAIASTSESILGLEPADVREDARYTIRQTSSPAVILNLLPLNDRSTERYISQPWNAAKEAYAIYAGLLAHLDDEAALAPGVMVFNITRPDGRPASGATATLDGYAAMRADDEGALAVTSLTPGTHLLEVALHGYQPKRSEFEWPPPTAADTATVRLTAPQ